MICTRCGARLSRFRMLGDTLCAPCQRTKGEWIIEPIGIPIAHTRIVLGEQERRPRCPCGLLVERDRRGLCKRWCTTCRKQRTWARRRVAS